MLYPHRVKDAFPHPQDMQILKIFSDTINYTKIYQIRRNNLISAFAIIYQKNISKNVGYGDKSMDEDMIYSDFKQFVMKKQSNFDLTMGEKEERFLKNFIKATIAKNIWDKNIYFKILSEEDEYILKAVQVLG